MTEQIGTPGSNADTSINGSSSKLNTAAKDKACPFCHQQFTSSSLGRHLDLYIKDKHPKPPDGIHIVDEIRKLRGGITRRQPRNSLRRRETSTPGEHEKGSPRPDSTAEDRSPSVAHDDVGTSNLMYSGRPRMYMQPPSWEATGVMNNIPTPVRNSDTKSMEGEEREVRRMERIRPVNRQALAKSAFDQKEKMMEALDNAKAAELALREIMGSLKAANRKKLSIPDIFQYDPLTFDFPALCIHCLPPPPTLHATVPMQHATSWNISPPGDNQYEAVRAHFANAFRNYRNTLALASTAPEDDMSYPPPPTHLFEEPDHVAKAIQAEAESHTLEQKVNSHLNDIFAAWTTLSSSRRSEVWATELARGIGRKSDEIKKLQKEKEYEAQVIDHLRTQYNDLSRLQQPREFRLVPPQTIPVSREAVNFFGDCLEKGQLSGVGFTILDRNEEIETVVERAITRWKAVVREARTAPSSGLQNQRSLSGDSLHLSPAVANAAGRNSHTSTGQLRSSSLNTAHNVAASSSLPLTNGMEGLSGEDADADADMEEEEPYAEIGDLSAMGGNNGETNHGLRSNGYRLMNGVGQQASANRGGMDGIINSNGAGASGMGAFGRVGS